MRLRRWLARKRCSNKSILGDAVAFIVLTTTGATSPEGGPTRQGHSMRAWQSLLVSMCDEWRVRTMLANESDDLHGEDPIETASD